MRASRFALFAALVALTAPALRAQGASEEAAVRRAALDYLEGFYEGDTAKLTRGIWPEVRKYGYWNDKGTYTGEAMSYKQIIEYGLNVKSGKSKVPANPPKDVKIFEIQDQTAAVKITAWWGTDYLLLAKEKGKWMITHVLWQGPLKQP
ncbi:MAG TPA: nuclear transport factor 2 family protein [Gemmatimonadaceae bacterium]|nr:nuclear transport factor 2 family protein [Gemmatimonadaceae bacterium]